MNPDDEDLKSQFEALRQSEGILAPDFRSVLVAATSEKAPVRFRPLLIPLAAAAVLGLILWPRLPQKTATAPSLAESLPAFLPTAPASDGLFCGPLLADGLPSDALLPFHLQIRL